MRFLPRSHLGGFVRHVRTPRSERRGNILMDGQEVELTPEEEGATVANVLRPGECSMHDGEKQKNNCTTNIAGVILLMGCSNTRAGATIVKKKKKNR